MKPLKNNSEPSGFSAKKEATPPGTWQVINASIQIMQDRITRANLGSTHRILLHPVLTTVGI